MTLKKDPEILKQFRGTGPCEACRRWCWRLECHHWRSRGHGGGSRIDLPINLIALGGAFACNCHGYAQRSKEFNDSLLPIIARREGTTPEAIREEINRLLREGKKP